MPLGLSSSPHFPSPFDFPCGEPVGESERGRPFPLRFLFGSCLNAHASPNEHWPFVIQRMHAPLRDLFFEIVFAFCLCFTFARSSFCKSVLVSIFRFDGRILDVLLKMSLDHQLQSAMVIFLVAECRLLTMDLPHIFQLFRHFNLHLVQTLSNMLSVGRSITITAQKTSSHFASKA